MGEAEYDEEVIDSMEESLDELRELESEEITANDDYNFDDQEELSAEVAVTPPKKTRRNKPIIPLSATPLEVFMLTYDFTIAEVASVTKLSQDTLLDIIRGDMPTEYQKQRVRLTTGVKL